jgi:cytidylate kinase
MSDMKKISPLKITITGDLGSGKSILRDKLVENDNFIPYSTGVLQREYAEKLGMTTLELNHYSETHPEVDEYIDNGLRNLSNSAEKYIIDSRLAWHFVKPSYKIYLSVSPLIAAERVLNATERGNTEAFSHINEALESLKARNISENQRFLSLYGVDCLNFTNYDLIIDTSFLTPAETYNIAVNAYNSNEMNVFYASLKNIYPNKEHKIIKYK